MVVSHVSHPTEIDLQTIHRPIIPFNRNRTISKVRVNTQRLIHTETLREYLEYLRYIHIYIYSMKYTFDIS